MDEEQRIKDIRDIIYERILCFRKAAYTFSGWRNLMEDDDSNNMCSVRFIDSVKKKAKYLLHSLTIMLETRDSDPTLTWFKACVADIDKIKQFAFAHLCSEDDNDYPDQ
jgi:hypothetical protein